MACYFLLQGIFPTQGLNLGLLHCRQILCLPSHRGHRYSKMYWATNRRNSIIFSLVAPFYNPPTVHKVSSCSAFFFFSIVVVLMGLSLWFKFSFNFSSSIEHLLISVLIIGKSPMEKYLVRPLAHFKIRLFHFYVLQLWRLLTYSGF